MTDIDRTIQDVEQLYRSITGRPPGNGEATPQGVIPPETDPARYVEGQMDRLLQLLGSSPAVPQQAYTPPVSLWETDECYLAVVDLPGVPRDSVKVSVAGQGIVVQGTRPNPMAVANPQARLRHQEHPVGSCLRMVPLPADASLDQVEARIIDGTLHLKVPRAGARGRNIEIH